MVNIQVRSKQISPHLSSERILSKAAAAMARGPKQKLTHCYLLGFIYIKKKLRFCGPFFPFELFKTCKMKNKTTHVSEKGPERTYKHEQAC